MASWFIGFPTPIVLQLEPPEEVRVLALEDRHLTVAFFGQCGEARSRNAFALAPSPPTLEITLGRTVLLGRPERPCALAVTIEKGRSDLERFIAEWRNPLRIAADLPKEDRDALPHITFARIRPRSTEGQYNAAARWWKEQALGELRCKLSCLALFAPADAEAETHYKILGEKPSI